MNKKRNRAALMALFPNIETLNYFINDIKNTDRIDSIIRFAVKNEIIKEPDIHLLETFIENKGNKLSCKAPIKGISFGELIDKRKQYLGISDSVRKITRSINMLLTTSGLYLPMVNNGMFTRLKNEPVDTAHKRDAIRGFSFWLGFNFPDAITQWNYSSIMDMLTIESKKTSKSSKRGPEKRITEGVRISFAMEGVAENIKKTYEWLKIQITETISYLGLHHIKTKQIVSLFPGIHIDIHKSEGPSGKPSNYDKALRDAMAIAHQISIKSSLYFGGDKGQNLVIAIAAGEYLRLEPLVQALLSPRFQQISMIRVSQFARLCARISDIKVIFHDHEERMQMPDGQIISAYFIKCFWTALYYDFVPDLLKNRLLPDYMNSSEVKQFSEELHFQDQNLEFKALEVMYLSPRNDILTLEIAKTLAGVGLFQEANTVLSSILSNDPCHLAARCLRMIVLLNLALYQKTISMFEVYYFRSISECRFIMNIGPVYEPEVYCDCGLVHFWGAMRYASFIHSVGEHPENTDGHRIAQEYNRKIGDLMVQAQTYFEEGTVVSSTGSDNRCLYWYLYAMAMNTLIKSKPEYIKSKNILTDKHKVFHDTGDLFFAQIGWRDERFDRDYYIRRFYEAIRKYKNSVLHRSYLPNVLYSFATIMFDFSPVLTNGIFRQIVTWLQEAKELTQTLIDDNIITLITSCTGLILPAGDFIHSINDALNLIHDKIPNLFDEAEDMVINLDIFDGAKLLPQFFDGNKFA